MSFFSCSVVKNPLGGSLLSKKSAPWIIWWPFLEALRILLLRAALEMEGPKLRRAPWSPLKREAFPHTRFLSHRLRPQGSPMKMQQHRKRSHCPDLLHLPQFPTPPFLWPCPTKPAVAFQSVIYSLFDFKLFFMGCLFPWAICSLQWNLGTQSSSQN